MIDKIIKGDKFECVKSVAMDQNGYVAYIKGKIYTSESDGCITDEQCNKQHYWSNQGVITATDTKTLAAGNLFFCVFSSQYSRWYINDCRQS